MKAERIVCDTNVLISGAIAPAGKQRAVLVHIRQNAKLLISAAGLYEVRTRLNRPKFDRYLDLDERHEFLRELALTAEVIEVPGHLRVCRDPDDDKIIETAIVGRADCLVTGDADILSLRPIGEAGAVSTVEDTR